MSLCFQWPMVKHHVNAMDKSPSSLSILSVPQKFCPLQRLMTNPKTTKAQWPQRVEAWHDGRLSQKAWGRQNGVRPSQLGYWKQNVWVGNTPASSYIALRAPRLKKPQSFAL